MENKDWKGDYNSIYKTLGASSHSKGDREENDFYATDPNVIDDLVKIVDLDENIWENACGMLHLSNRLRQKGYNVRNSDIINRINDNKIEIIDFLNYRGEKWKGDIVTNPPYKYAEEWVYKSMEIMEDGKKLCLFLKLLFLEGQRRKKMFEEYPPKFVYVYSKRQKCVKNGDFSKYDSNAVCYAWFIWEKGYKGETLIKWI